MTQGKRLNSGTTFLQPEGPVETLHTTVKTDYKDLNEMLQSQQYDIENHHNIYEAQERYINDLEVYAAINSQFLTNCKLRMSTCNEFG
jgi:hypothetical protein